MSGRCGSLRSRADPLRCSSNPRVAGWSRPLADNAGYSRSSTCAGRGAQTPAGVTGCSTRLKTRLCSIDDGQIEWRAGSDVQQLVTFTPAPVADGPCAARYNEDMTTPAPLTVTPPAETLPDKTTKPLILPPYAVILHNDEVNDQHWVVRSLLVCVPEVTRQQAAAIMREADQQGRAVVVVCPLERAELYRDRLESRGLTATIEKG